MVTINTQQSFLFSSLLVILFLTFSCCSLKQALVSYADRPVGWQALRRGWNSNRAPTFPEGSRSDPLQVSPHRGSPAQRRPLLQGENGGGGGGWPRTQPLRATAPLGPSESPSSSPSSHIQTSSAVTTLVPENRAGFSSITISSRKVSRSASLPGSAHPGQSPSPPPPAADQPMDPNSRQLTLKRQATIVKVTEQRTVLSSPGPEPGPGAGPEGSSGSLSAHQATDTVVRRRQATIIKVTERRQSFTPAATAGGRKPEYRHSYAGVGHQGDYTLHRTSTHPSPDGVLTPDKASLHTDSVHRSTLSLTLSGHATVAPPPATAVAPPSLPHMRPGRSARSVRPQSCYGNVSEPSKELVTAAPPAARKWSFGEGGDPMGPLERRASPSLTLIKAPGRFPVFHSATLLVSSGVTRLFFLSFPKGLNLRSLCAPVPCSRLKLSHGASCLSTLGSLICSLTFDVWLIDVIRFY